ncbi:MAG: radical SAM protein, partial [Deltaproteobacteria bacterium]|nr:radical SAM protein [Deltaproteobacteria bacterium]
MTQTFAPLAAVWEITMACNMRCRHCGSACTVAQPGELTTAEALTLCDELADMGLKMVTLSGGEPLLRHDWPDIARRFTDRGVVVMMISNGWFFNSQVIEKARDSGVESIGISLDGPEKTHDSIRQKGAFARVMRALEQMSKENFTSSVVTTVMKYNLFQLPEMKAILEETGVSRWQFQLGVPMGQLAKNRSQVIDPGQIQ